MIEGLRSGKDMCSLNAKLLYFSAASIEWNVVFTPKALLPLPVDNSGLHSRATYGWCLCNNF
jgi:hypothetical protein